MFLMIYLTDDDLLYLQFVVSHDGNLCIVFLKLC